MYPYRICNNSIKTDSWATGKLHESGPSSNSGRILEHITTSNEFRILPIYVWDIGKNSLISDY